MHGCHIITIGASAGGVPALQRLAGDLADNISAAVFVVLHMAPHWPSVLSGILGRAGPLQALDAVDGMPFERGHIYVAPPDRHMLLEPGHIRVLCSPLENRWRPAVDPLFRSAAQHYGPQTIGVVLTGGLSDGTAGLQEIKRQGGLAVVQDPLDARFPGMPLSALHRVAVDHCVPLAALGGLLSALAEGEPPVDSQR